MKNRLTTLDIVCLIKDLQKSLGGMRVDRIYDIDKKTYLIRLSKTDCKLILLLESGVRFHTTSFEWPKNPAPSGFSMKLRKHLNNKRLENITQLGADRIVDFQFGANVAANHILLELYDKGNIVLTDHEFNILSVLRPHVQGEDRFAAHERYAVERAKERFTIEKEETEELLQANEGKSLRETFLSKLEFGPALFSHVLKSEELTPQTKIPASKHEQQLLLEKLTNALEAGKTILTTESSHGGFITLSSPTVGGGKKKKGMKEETPVEETQDLNFYDQFHPSVLMSSYSDDKKVEFSTFNEAVDDFFSKIESQKLDMKKLSHEKEAFKKLEKVKMDQQKRLNELKEGQEVDKKKAELITVNRNLVEKAIAAIRQMIANQISWDEIWEQIQDAKKNGDALASTITGLNLHRNHFSIELKDPYEEEENSAIIEIDLGLSAFSNATKYYDLKKASAKKEERTLDSQEKAFKSTEKKTKASLKEVEAIHSIKKARKVLWFEKFHWFISSENYLVLCGRDSQQNALLVSKYMKPKDVYLHADAHGAPTVLIKNDNPSEAVPPKTLNEAGCYAISFSGSWDSKIIAAAYYVYGEQVSRSAPSGEYLPAGSFMIYGKKNYLPPCQLVLGFGFLFRLTDESLEKHKNDRPRRTLMSSQEDLSKGSAKTRLEDAKKLSAEQDSNNDDTDQETDEENDLFPDTHVSISVDGSISKIRTRTSSSVSSEGAVAAITTASNSDDIEPTLIVCNTQPTTSIKIKQQKGKSGKKNSTDKGKGAKALPIKVEEPVVPKDSPQHTNKRGQHGRKKKLKEKYKFQDEEERLLRMQLLQGAKVVNSMKENAGNNVESSQVCKKTESESSSLHEKPELSENKTSDSKESDLTVAQPDSDNQHSSKEANDAVLTDKDKNDEKSQQASPEEQENEEDERETAETELDLLNALTGMPREDDELLFAVPVIAPYSSLQNYKFKIKMVPGTAKRGKAARTAWQSFLRDKTATQREKDLFKSVKDQDLSRNFPGNVKLSGIDKSKH